MPRGRAPSGTNPNTAIRAGNARETTQRRCALPSSITPKKLSYKPHPTTTRAPWRETKRAALVASQVDPCSPDAGGSALDLPVVDPLQLASPPANSPPPSPCPPISILKRIPKASGQFGKKLAAILNTVVSKNTWDRLLCFYAHWLQAPRRGGKQRSWPLPSTVSCVKNWMLCLFHTHRDARRLPRTVSTKS